MPLLMLLALAAADAPPVIIVERVTLGLKAAEAAVVRQELVDTFARGGVPARLGEASCPDRPCLHALAKGWSAWLVGVSVAKSKRGLTFDLEAVDEVRVLDQRAFLLLGKRVDQSPEVESFVARLREQRERLPSDRPVAEARTIEAVPVPGGSEQPPAPAFDVRVAPTPAVAPKVLAVGAASVGLIGAGLLVGGLVSRGDLEGRLQERPVVTTLTRDAAERQAGVANALTAAGLALLGLGVAGGATAVVLALP